MADIFWEPYIATRTPSASSKVPQVTLSMTSGRISFNIAVCELIPNLYKYKYAEIYRGMVDKTFKKICIKFTNERTVKSLPLSRKKYKNSFAGGMVLHSKSLIRDIYRTASHLPDTSHFLIEALPCEENNRIVFDIETSLLAAGVIS